MTEGIKWENISFVDNDACISLIDDQRQASLFKLLDEQFMMG
jgi:myosin heavy subunit